MLINLNDIPINISENHSPHISVTDRKRFTFPYFSRFIIDSLHFRLTKTRKRCSICFPRTQEYQQYSPINSTYSSHLIDKFHIKNIFIRPTTGTHSPIKKVTLFLSVTYSPTKKIPDIIFKKKNRKIMFMLLSQSFYCTIYHLKISE